MFTPTGRPPWCLLICILVAVKTVVTNSDFCIVTRSTKKVVPTCPDSLDKWNEASKRKNCTQYASQCSEPEKLEYHCVINPFINETLEVCAYGQYIISGHCTEYSSSGNLIQPNLNTNCMNFSSKPCPFTYKSTEAYKYKGCYDLTKKTTVTEQTEAKSDPKFTTVASYISSSQIFVKVVNEDNAERSTGVLTIGVITGLVLLSITAVLLYLLIRHLKKKHYRSRGNSYSVKYSVKNSNEVLHFTNVENENGNNEIAPSGQQINKGDRKKITVEVEEDETPDHRNIYEEESKSLRVPVDTETEDVHIAPSGQFIGNGIKTKEIKIVDEEILPEHDLKPKEDPVEDCQTLLNRISDGLTGLAIIHSKNSDADNLLNLANLHNRYENPNFSFRQESRHTFEDDLAKVEYMIEYFKKQTNKQGICKE